MELVMAGIDFRSASIEQREAFAFTKKAIITGVKQALSLSGADGCIILSTCNRTELWLSGSSNAPPDKILCQLKGVESLDSDKLLHVLQGEEAARHLFTLASGLESQIFGDDQIISQVKNAVALARSAGGTDVVLEKLFQYAVTSAKQVKTVLFRGPRHPGVAESALAFLKNKQSSFNGCRCLMIGSGEIGKQVARLLLENGCDVTITQRSKHAQPALLPPGCHVIPFEDRLLFLSQMQVVVSATLSPHFTLTKQEAQPYLAGRQRLLLDLAVPRDIDPQLASIPYVDLYDMDDLHHCQMEQQRNEHIRQAEVILAKQYDAFLRWYYFQPWHPSIDAISRSVSKDLLQRMEKPMHSFCEKDQEQFRHALEDASQKAIRKMLYRVRDHMKPTGWDNCLQALQTEDKRTVPGPRQLPPHPSHPSLRFPLFIDLTGKQVVIVGGGAVALRRTRTLLQFGCNITVISPSVLSELKNYALSKQIIWISKQFEAGDCKRADLVTACTNYRLVNHQVAMECRLCGIPVSVADCPEECTFYFPAIVMEEGIVIGLASNGTKHSLVKKQAAQLRKRTEHREELR